MERFTEGSLRNASRIGNGRPFVASGALRRSPRLRVRKRLFPRHDRPQDPTHPEPDAAQVPEAHPSLPVYSKSIELAPRNQENPDDLNARAAQEQLSEADSMEIPTSAPEDRLASFMQAHPNATYADIKYSAQVHTPEFQDWRKDRLKREALDLLPCRSVL